MKKEILSSSFTYILAGKLGIKLSIIEIGGKSDESRIAMSSVPIERIRHLDAMELVIPRLGKLSNTIPPLISSFLSFLIFTILTIARDIST
jgi:hypothetical protein